MKKPIIGVVPLFDTERDSYWMLPGYMDGISMAGGLPVIMPLTVEKCDVKQLTDEFDGFLFTGGHDVSPEAYGAQKSEACGECLKIRDEMEAILLDEVLKKDKPVLGICRGIQFINVQLGGTLYQDLPTEKASDTEHHQSPPYHIPVHDVEIVKNSVLYDILQKTRISVNSYHHQAIKELSPRLRAMTYSEDGLTEAVYMPDKKFVVAVQWHPEFSYKTDEDSRKIFKAFLQNI